jgi:protein-S-isoprenylcysteine O-methyltransferase Ste14
LKLIAVTGLAWAAIEIWMTIRPKPAKAATHDRNSTLVLAATIFGGLYATDWLGAHHGLPLPGASLAWLAVGLALMWLGIGIRVWAISMLGRYFRGVVSLEPGQPVVESGPYRLVRHPSYAGGWLGLVGYALTRGDLLAVLVLAVLAAVGILQRIRVEEKVLAEGLGEPYRDYMRRTNRLVPGVY